MVINVRDAHVREEVEAVGRIRLVVGLVSANEKVSSVGIWDRRYIWLLRASASASDTKLVLSMVLVFRRVAVLARRSGGIDAVGRGRVQGEQAREGR